VSNARFGHRRAPLLRFFEEGIATAIGTDSMVANNRMDLLEEARTAALLAQAGQGRGDLVSASQLLWMLTMGGAGALGLEQHVGSLEAGKRADMVVFSLGGAHTQPAIDPHETAIHALRGSDAEMVMVDGKEIFRENRHAVDLSRDGHIAGAVADKLRQGRH
jgi:5-methylthioadenosine/S-adenosylhomocysteine deaminase